MKNVYLLAILLSLTAGVPAMANTVCATSAATGGDGNAVTGVSAPTLNNATCGSGNAVTISLNNDTENELIKWHSNAPFPSGLTLGNLSSLDAKVLFSSNTVGDQPYYDLAFYPTDTSLGNGSGDLITLLENQASNVSSGDMAMNANTTKFSVYDLSTDAYLLGGQANTQTIASLLGLAPSLSGDQMLALDIAIGSATYGTCSGPCADSLTVNSLDIGESSPVPEPESVVMVGSGLSFLVSALAIRRRHGASLGQSI